MKNFTYHKGKLEILRRLPSSKNGNPRYLLKIDGWTCRTAVDSSLGYSIPNYNGETVEAYIGTHYGLATVENVRFAKK